MRLSTANSWALVILLVSSQIPSVVGYTAGSCCELAKKQKVFIGDVPPFEDQKCAQNYTAGSPAAEPLFVTYRFCKAECPGIGLSEAKQPSQWAAPIVQFILPSVIFSMTIPRKKKIDFGYLLDFKGLRTKPRAPSDPPPTFWIKFFNSGLRRLVYAALFIFIMIPVIIDTLIWIFMIIVGAGNMIVAGLLEAHLDFRIVKYCQGTITNDNDLRRKRALLTTIVAGNLQQEKGKPQEVIPERLLLHPSDASPAEIEDMFNSRLLSLLDVQASFGGAVGSPVLFFLGAFIYTILDLEQNPSSEDAAISLAFGIEWMNIVNVAIVSGCLLACNNPSTSAGMSGVKHEALKSNPLGRNPTAQYDGQFPEPKPRPWTREDYLHYILGWSDAYETDFQPVSLWDRGTNKMAWIKESEEWKKEEGDAVQPFRNALKIGWKAWALKNFFAIVLVALPPALGGVVAFYFPPRGVGCRCMSFMIYGFCQALLCIISTIRNAEEVKNGPFPVGWMKLLYGALWLISFFAAVGGTTFQIVGVFRNCVCATLVPSWYNLWRNNPMINLATDTQAARNASRSWIVMGIIATVFVGSVSYLGWWYQKLLRHGFTEAVRELHYPSRTPPQIGAYDRGAEQYGFEMTPVRSQGETAALLQTGPYSPGPARDSASLQRRPVSRDSVLREADIM